MARGRLAAFLTVAALMAGCSGAAAPTTPTATATNRPCIVTVSLVAPVGVPGTIPLVCSSPGSSCSISFPPVGRQSTVYVETGAACAWTAASDQTWTTVAPSAGNGPGTVTISVPANPASTRASHVTIAATTIGVTQSGATPCTFSFAPLNLSISSAGGAAAVTQTASGNGCRSVVESDASWVTIRNRIVTGDNVAIAFSVAANPNSGSRTGRLVVTPYLFLDDEGAGALAPVTITVMQSGAS
jgi:hypothetical protein